ncbi:hypothetical protein D3C72_922660 [compost metagenome]
MDAGQPVLIAAFVVRRGQDAAGVADGLGFHLGLLVAQSAQQGDVADPIAGLAIGGVDVFGHVIVAGRQGGRGDETVAVGLEEVLGQTGVDAGAQVIAALDQLAGTGHVHVVEGEGEAGRGLVVGAAAGEGALAGAQQAAELDLQIAVETAVVEGGVEAGLDRVLVAGGQGLPALLQVVELGVAEGGRVGRREDGEVVRGVVAEAEVGVGRRAELIGGVRRLQRGGRPGQVAVQRPQRRGVPLEAGAQQADLALGDRLVQADDVAARREGSRGLGLVGDVAVRLGAELEALLVVLHAGPQGRGFPAEVVVRTPLQLAVQARALLGVIVPEVAQLGRHLDAVAGRRAGVHRLAGGVVLAHRRGGDLDLRDVVVQLLVRGADHHAPFVVGAEAAAGGEAQAIGGIVVAHVAAALIGAVGGHAVEEGALAVEGAAGPHIDDAADGVAVVLGRHRLDDFQAAGHDRGDDVHRHGAGALVDRADEGAVDGGAVIGRGQAAQDRPARLALVLHDRHAGDAAQGGGGVVVRQLADVVRRHGVHDLELAALDGDGGALGLALAGDDDLVDFGDGFLRGDLGERQARGAERGGRQQGGGGETMGGHGWRAPRYKY